MGTLLYILSLILRALLVPVGIVYGIIKLFHESHFDRAFKYTDQKFLVMAKSVDKFGNAVCVELFNDTLITKDSAYKFGRIDQTISEVIGYNLKFGTLTKTGKTINWILCKIEKNHTTKAIEDFDQVSGSG
jgi:hypothetical protein